MEQMEMDDDGQNSKLLLPSEDKDMNQNRVVGMVKERKWFIIFGVAFLLAIIIIVSFVATKSSSSNKCSSHTDGNECFFKGLTRLPKALKPQTYEVRLVPNLSTFEFNGSVLMVVKCLEATNRVVFHQKGLTFEETSVWGRDEGKGNSKGEKKVIKIKQTGMDLVHDQVIWKTSQTLEKNKEYTISVKFHGKLNENLEGFYKSSYKTKSGEIRHLATTHFEATAARQAFPCFDEPAMKANFTIIITHSTEYIALSNMPAEKNQLVGKNLTETQFMQSVKMSTYLVAFVVCDFAHVGASAGHVKVRIWAPKDQINGADLALNSAAGILKFYEKYFGIKYPLPKADLIAIPDFAAGAMENWGLITYRLTSLLSDKESSSSNRQWVATVVAHELAHQWFGNLVTMKWWDDLWLNEGFASYIENIGVNSIKPEWKMADQFLISSIHRSMALDQLATSHPISVVVKDPADISSLFDDISYHKGSSLINMMNNVLGEKVFLDGLQSYLRKYAFSNAVTDDLWNSLSQNTSVNVKKVMDTWTLQMGFPLVTITKQADGTFLATQEHFLVNPTTKPALKSPFNYKWYIPLNYRTDSSTSSSEINWMNLGDTQIKVQIGKDGWLKANHKQFGFYRVNYPVENWENLAKLLQNDHTKLSAADRGGLIDDAFTLARAGKLSYAIPLNMSRYLYKEFEYVPWRIALSSLTYIGSRLVMTPYYGLYQSYVLSKVTPVLDKLGYKDSGKHLKLYLRNILFGKAVLYEYPPAVNEAKKMFNDFMTKNTSVTPNFRYTVYDTGVRSGGKAEWEFIWKKYQKEIVASEKSKLLSAVTSTKEAWLLQRCLEYTLDPSLIKSQDADGVMSLVAANANGRLLAWDFFQQNFEEIRRRYGSEAFSFGRLIKSVSAHFQTQFHFDQVKEFFEVHSNVGSAERSVLQVYETINTNIRWVKDYENEVVEWLKKNQ